MAHPYRRDSLDLLKGLCEAIGIDPDMESVRSITIHVPIDDVITTTVERIVTDAEGRRIVAALKVRPVARSLAEAREMGIVP